MSANYRNALICWVLNSTLPGCVVNEGLGWDSLKPNEVILQFWWSLGHTKGQKGRKVCLSGDLTSKSFCGLIFFRNEKRDPGCLGDLLGIILPSYVGIIININKPYKDSY